MNIILRKPIITEKSMKLTEQGLFTFLVDKNALKPEIAKAVARKFSVDVLSVKTINTKGERRMQRKVRGYYQTPGFKKAIVLVKKGQSIPVFEKPKDASASSAQGEAVVTSTEGEPQILKEKKDIFRRTKVKVEKAPHQTMQGGAPTTQRKVITGK